MLKENKARECQNEAHQLQWKEKGEEEDHVKNGGKRLKRIRRKKQADDGRRSLGMEEYCTGRRDSQRTVVLKE